MSCEYGCAGYAQLQRQFDRVSKTIIEYRHKLREVEVVFNQWGRRTMMDAEFIEEMKKLLTTPDGEKQMLGTTPFAEIAQAQAKGSHPVQSV